MQAQAAKALPDGHASKQAVEPGILAQVEQVQVESLVQAQLEVPEEPHSAHRYRQSLT